MARVRTYGKKSKTLFVENPSNKDLERLWRLLDGENKGPDFFISVSEIPDVDPPMRSNTTSSGRLRGLYDMNGGNLVAMPEKYVWVKLTTKRSIFSDSLIYVRGRTLRVVSLPSIVKAFALPNDCEIVIATETQSKKLDPKNEVDLFLQRAIDNHDLEDSLFRHMVRDRMRSQLNVDPQTVTSEDLASDLERDQPRDLQRIIEVDLDKVQQKVDKLLGEILEKYPLLSSQANTRDFLDYIQLVDQTRSK